MSDKPLAVLVAALVVAPLCAICILGPAALGAMIAGVWGGFTGNTALLAVAVVILASALAYALKRRQRRGRDRASSAARNAAPEGMPHE